MTLEHFELFAVLQADDVIGEHRSLDRHRRLLFFHDHRLSSHRGQRGVDGLDQARQCVRPDRIVGDVGRDDLGHEAQDLRPRRRVAHFFLRMVHAALYIARPRCQSNKVSGVRNDFDRSEQRSGTLFAGGGAGAAGQDAARRPEGCHCPARSGCPSGRSRGQPKRRAACRSRCASRAGAGVCKAASGALAWLVLQHQQYQPCRRTARVPVSVRCSRNTISTCLMLPHVLQTAGPPSTG